MIVWKSIESGQIGSALLWGFSFDIIQREENRKYPSGRIFSIFDFRRSILYTLFMTTGTITKTKDYLVIKIPLRDIQKSKEIGLAITEEDAVKEGLRAVAEGRVSKEFKTVREAISFLDNL